MRQYRMRWDNVRRRMVDLWVPHLRDRIAIETDWHPKDTVGTSRIILSMDGRSFWDFPTDYYGTYPNRAKGWPGSAAPRGQTIYKGSWDDEHIPVRFIERYLDTPRDELFEPIKGDYWDLGDILRAADRRIGYERLMWWSFFGDLDMGSPARTVLAARFENRAPR